MQKILGYLRHYQRWDGRPGVSIKEQRSMINWIARTIEEGDELFATRRIYREEAGKGWPILRKLVEWASEDLVHDYRDVILQATGARGRGLALLVWQRQRLSRRQ